MTKNYTKWYIPFMDAHDLTKAEKTKRYIIEKTAPIFNRKGYAGTSISDLTEATGLTRGGIYGNFGSKDDVAVSVFMYNVDFIIGEITGEMRALTSYFEKLMVYPKFYRRMYGLIVSYGGCPILNTLVEADDTHKQLLALALQAIQRWKKDITYLVRKGKQTGEIKEAAREDEIAELMISLIEGGVLMTKATGSDGYILNALDHLESILQSIKAD